MNKFKITNKRNVYCALIVMVLSIAGIIQTYVGSGWSKSSGEAAKMYPRLVYGILIVAALCLLVMELLGKVSKESAAIETVKWWQVPLILIIGVAFFQVVLYVGVAVGIFVYLMVLINLFDEDPKKHIVPNLVVAVVATVVLYLIFQKVLPIITMNQILI